MSQELLRAENISKNFGAIQALRQVNLILYQNEIVGLVGDNAAGKSTLLKVIAGIYKPDEGRLFLGGREVRFKSPIESRSNGVEMVFQDFMLCPDLDIISNVFLGREKTNYQVVNRKAMRKAIEPILEETKFEFGSFRRKVRYLSGGQQQMVSILRACAFRPKILLLDEPTASLSASASIELLQFLTKLKERHSMIYVSHDLPNVIKHSDRIVVLRAGTVVAEKNPDETDPVDLIKAFHGV
ncbi:MAG: ATP-binding cassette domain-containing protein [Gammaproteobacteria bacterium]|nr:ATP-binding cassette domain-containing protein [Gammaproteobacteria bacterium]